MSKTADIMDECVLENSYSLRLASGQDWLLMSCPESVDCLKEMARIMGLRSGTPAEPINTARIIFVRDRLTKRRRSIYARGQKQEDYIKMSSKEWISMGPSFVKVELHRKVPVAIVDMLEKYDAESEMIKMWQAIQPIYLHAISNGGMPFHAALIEYRGYGLLLAASGGGGKSTCCNRLPPGWHALCDDESLIVQNQEGNYFAHPFPTWSDYIMRRSVRTWDVQKSVPLKSIFFLQKADSDGIKSLGCGEASVMICKAANEACRWNWSHFRSTEAQEQRKIIFQRACRLAGVVPAFTLSVSLCGRFWEKMEEVLQENEQTGVAKVG